ncbi:MAG TPA: glycosyltransferase family 39 protein [Allosphingosinicella sp.]|nr:glycosyltransferase family 39 protein [Allosphingosinicella sp.]
MATRAAGIFGTIRGSAEIPVALPLLAFAFILYWVNPVGYVGGGGDDWQYLSAAECWAANGPCLPRDHWGGRWPLIAPMAASIAVLGESRAAMALVPLLWSVAVLLLFARIVERLAGRTAALAAGLVLLLTPVFAIQLARPNVDHVELTFLLAALLGWIEAARSARRGWALLLGFGLGMAVLARETSIVFVAAVGIAFLRAPMAQKRVLVWATPAFALPLAAEMITYLFAAGDPFYRLGLAFGHTRIPSAELADWVDTSRSPFFNPEFIAGWRAANGIEAHWTVKPLLNLVTHANIGMTLIGALALSIAAPKAGAERRTILALLAIAGGAALVFIYALGIDPKPRMFLPLAAAAAAAAGIAAVALWRSGRRLVPMVVALFLIPPAFVSFLAVPRNAPAERAAAEWLVAAPGAVTLDETTRRYLALVPGARALPVDAARPLRLTVATEPCAASALRSIATHEGEWALLAAMRSRSLGLTPETGLWLCLGRRAGP